MFRVVLLIVLCNVCFGVSVGPAKYPASGLTTTMILKDWMRAGDAINLKTSELHDYGMKTYRKLPIEANDLIVGHKANLEEPKIKALDHKLFLEKYSVQLNSDSKVQIPEKNNHKTLKLTERKQNQEHMDDVESFRTRFNSIHLEDETDSSEISDEAMIPAILYKLQVFSAALCSEWNHKFAVFKAFVMISCLAIGFVAMITLLVYFFDVRKRQNKYMKLKLLV